MELTKIIDDIQHSIGVPQRKLDELRQMDDEAAQSILLTRQEAADFVGVSLRQFDRDWNATVSRKSAPSVASASASMTFWSCRVSATRQSWKAGAIASTSFPGRASSKGLWEVGKD